MVCRLQLKSIVFSLICALILVCIVSSVSAAPTLSLSWYRDNGYSMGNDIGGYFTLTAEVSPDVVNVEFYIDNELQVNDTSAPFSWYFNTGNYSLGTHVINVVAYNSNGDTATAETERNFVEYSTDFLIIIFAIAVVILAVSLVAALFWAKKKEAKKRS